jgi:hypothetical protein
MVTPMTGEKTGAACGPGRGGCHGALWGWAPPDLPADTPLKHRADRLLPRTGWPCVLYFAAIVGLLNLAPHLPSGATSRSMGWQRWRAAHGAC